MPKHSNLVRPLAALAAALLLSACSAETAPAPRAERPVQVQSVAYQAEDAARDFVGFDCGVSRDGEAGRR